jgi:hypothetical protein
LACWPLVPKFVGSNTAEAVGFLRAEKILCTPSFPWLASDAYGNKPTSNLGVQPQRMWKFSNCFSLYCIYKLLEEFADDKVGPVHSCRSGCKAVYVVQRANQLKEARWLRAEYIRNKGRRK